MQETVNKVTVGGERLNYYDRLIKTKPLTVTTTNKAAFDKELLTAAWAEVFDRLAMDFIYKPTFKANGKTFRPDFYLRDLDVFVVIKPEADNEQINYDDSITEMAYAAERDVIIGYADGRFAIADYCDREELNGDGKNERGLALDTGDTWLSVCYAYDEWYFCSAHGYWTCRNCGYYDGDSTMKVVLYGTESIFDFTDNLENRKVWKHKNAGRKIETLRSKIFGG